MNEQKEESPIVLEVCNYLQTHSITKLKQSFKLIVKRHALFPELVLFRYDMLQSPFESKIVQECRGIILNEQEQFKPICVPFFKFFNVDEKYSAHSRGIFRWDKPFRVYEKLDGSLCNLYYYKQQWHVSSNSLPDASGVLFDKTTFSELFWDIWNNHMHYQLPNNTDCVYMFEMCSPRHRILVPQTKESLNLLAVRNMKTLKEMEPEPIAQLYQWDVAPFFSQFTTLEQIRLAASKLNPLLQEGFVIRDINFNRIKIKSEQYVALSHLSLSAGKIEKNELSMLQVVRRNEGDEFLSYFLEFTTLYQRVKERYEKFIQCIVQVWEQIQKEIEIEEQSHKVIAKYVMKELLHGATRIDRKHKIFVDCFSAMLSKQNTDTIQQIKEFFAIQCSGQELLELIHELIQEESVDEQTAKLMEEEQENSSKKKKKKEKKKQQKIEHAIEDSIADFQDLEIDSKKRVNKKVVEDKQEEEELESWVDIKQKRKKKK